MMFLRTSFDQSKQGTFRQQPKARKGDLIFFKTNSRSQINHVGIVTDVNNDEVRFIHTSTSKGYNLLYKRTILSENTTEQILD
jgi:cell wall-associated NlpC family hydrolase